MVNQKHGWAIKLPDDQVEEIRERYARGGISQAALAREYGVTSQCVHYIVTGQRRTTRRGLIPHQNPTEPQDNSSASPSTWLNSLSSSDRKECAVARGLFGYFPDALALVARHSVRANEKHNPGEPVHWARDKSSDHEDCVARHSLSVAVDPDSQDDDGCYHIVCRAWRALAALQLWAETRAEKGQEI